MDDLTVPYAGLRVTLDPGLARLTGEVDLTAFVPGPAGTSSVDLGGVELAVDHAEPERACTLSIPIDRFSHLDTEGRLSSLIGFRGFGQLRSRLADEMTHDDNDGWADTDAPRLVQFTLGDASDPHRRLTATSLPDRRAAEFGQVITGLAVGTDPHEHALVRATAFVESAGRLVTLSPGSRWSITPSLKLWQPIDPARLDRWITRSAEIIADHDDLLRELDPDDYVRLHEHAQMLVRSFGTGMAWSRSLLLALPRRYHDLDDERQRRRTPPTEAARRAMGRSALSMAFEQLAAPDPMFDDVAAHSLAFQVERRMIIEPDEPSPRIQIVKPGRLEVQYDRKPPGSWLRVLDASSLALLAVVPIVAERRRWSAHAVVPRDVDAERLIVNATDAPLPASRPSNVDRMIEAIDAGREAASMAQRDAGDAWLRCADLWDDLGDDTRANRARAYATARERVGREPGVHDSIRRLVD